MSRTMTHEPEAIAQLKSGFRFEQDTRTPQWRVQSMQVQACRRHLAQLLGEQVISCFKIVPSFARHDFGRQWNVALLLERHLPIQAEIFTGDQGQVSFAVSSYDVYGRAQRSAGRQPPLRPARLNGLGQALVIAEEGFRRLEDMCDTVWEQRCREACLGTMPEEVWLYEQLDRSLGDPNRPHPGHPSNAEVERFLEKRRQVLEQLCQPTLAKDGQWNGEEGDIDSI